MSRRSYGVAAYCTATQPRGYRLANGRHEQKTTNHQLPTFTYQLFAIRSPAINHRLLVRRSLGEGGSRSYGGQVSPTRADLEAAREGGVGKIRQPTHVHFPAGNVAANDLAAWSIRQPPGQR